MAYLVLARKFRPALLNEVVGQQHITKTLKNAITSGRVGHAFLFSGPRGVGKTTTARILAKALNCENGPTATPCNECVNCLQISAGSYLDVIEIDGASNNGVENVREIREQVRFAPAAGRYKIYIIDEVHMLSNPAFNALLKTLEEPPEHVKFIFATTEAHKLPATILSRCQRYDFNKIPITDIIGNLEQISQKEGININKNSLHRIARAAEGSLRDAQSIFDQILSSCGQQVDDSEVKRILGIIDRTLIESVAQAIISHNGEQVLRLVEQLMEYGGNPIYFTQQLMGYFRQLLLLKLCQKPDDLLEVTDEELAVLHTQAKDVSVPELIQLIKIMLENEAALRMTLNQRITLEIILLKLSQLKPLLPIEEILDRLTALESSTPKNYSAIHVEPERPQITDTGVPQTLKPDPAPTFTPVPKPESVPVQYSSPIKEQ